MTRFFKRDEDGLEAELRKSPTPRPGFVDDLASRARVRSGPRPASRRIVVATAMSGAMVLGLGSTGALGAIGAAAKDTAGSITAILTPSFGGASAMADEAGPARDQYGKLIRVGICVPTGSATNPYSFIVVPRGEHFGRGGGGSIVGVASAADCPAVGVKPLSGKQVRARAKAMRAFVARNYAPGKRAAALARLKSSPNGWKVVQRDRALRSFVAKNYRPAVRAKVLAKLRASDRVDVVLKRHGYRF